DPAHGNRDAIGAEVTVLAGGRRWWASAQPAAGYLTSNDPAVHIGLGAVASVEAIQVLWPEGAKESFPGGPADRLAVLRKGQGKAVTP
ncbi:MAG TPA: ASPIC/UnbV domain-containing protein, partial [Verrucomicrobiae bacterium]|nr:ASPIC/UnbV domain-containing protein [Verrucomicrobiae bacterium]